MFGKFRKTRQSPTIPTDSSPGPSTSRTDATTARRPPPPPSVNNSVSNPLDAGTGLGIALGRATDSNECATAAVDRRGGARADERRVQLLAPNPGSIPLPYEASDRLPRGDAARRRSSSAQGVTFVDGDEGAGRTGGSAGNDADALSSRRRESHSQARGVDRSLSPTLYGTATPSGGPGSMRAVSPMSFSPSIASTFHNPYGPSVTALHDRDPNQIYAPTTWSDMAHQELVVNLSARERTRQEILWEVVASEERYVIELKSLVENYTNPLLHPLLSTSPRMSSPPTPSGQFTRQSLPAATASSADLPIAARFLRSSPSSLSSSSLDHLPEIRLEGDDACCRAALDKETRRSSSASSQPLPSPSPRNASSTGLGGVTGRLAAFAFGRSRQERSSSAPSSSRSSERDPVGRPVTAPPLPDALRRVLEATLDMLKGHEALSAKLKEQWTKSFPLVRGLGATWSDQPWFLQTYATYIVSLEEALHVIDSHLPAGHPTAVASRSSPHLRFRTSETRKQEQLDQQLTQYLQHLERDAAVAGESSLSICLSKPLMRMSKLPLLMQALLFHTDATTHEWEKTRAMALEVDALVRSIEDEKIEEEQRERTRDVLARIEGINDRGLMMPRSSRVLISEQPAPPSTASSLPLRKTTTKRSSRRVSTGSTGTFGKKADKEWLIRFTDVVIRAQKVGETNVPGSFSREKEKQGKQGKTKKSGPLRNTYRFLYVERWETAERAELAWNEFRARSLDGGEGADRDGSDGGETLDCAESRMSFRYDSDEPQPVPALRDFSSPGKKHSSRKTRAANLTSRRSASTPVPDHSVKFANRLRVGGGEGGATHGDARSPTPSHRHRFDSPTLSSVLKSNSHAPAAPSPPPPARPEKKGSSAISRVDTPSSVPPPSSGLPSSSSAVTIQAHPRDESTYNLYKMWSSTQESCH